MLATEKLQATVADLMHIIAATVKSMMTYAGAHHYVSNILSNNISSTMGGLHQHIEECRNGMKKVLAITQAGKHSMRFEVGHLTCDLRL